MLPTPNGPFDVVVYRFGDGNGLQAEEHCALVKGDIRGPEPVLTRIHSECLTGEVFGSLKCDCREQFDAAMAAIAKVGRGVIVYLRQEGRGIGLGNKIRAYALQAEGKDTVEANLALGFADDERSYDMAATILDDLGVGSVALMTNNPRKLAGLEQAGVKVARHVPHWVGSHELNSDYLEAKRSKLGHIK